MQPLAASHCLILFVAVFCLISGEDVYIPPYINPCNMTQDDFENCIKEQIENSLPYFTKGVPELGVPSLDPVYLSDIEIDGNGLKLLFTDAAMHGLSNSKLSAFKIQLGKKEDHFTLAFKGNMSLTAKYIVDGRILILPIKGKGDALVDCQNIEVRIESNLTYVKDKKGGEHLKLVGPNYKYDIEKTTFHLENLFNGNKELADTTHRFANENWKQIMDDLAPPAVKQIVRTCIKAINKFFASVTVQQIINNYTRET